MCLCLIKKKKKVFKVMKKVKMKIGRIVNRSRMWRNSHKEHKGYKERRLKKDVFLKIELQGLRIVFKFIKNKIMKAMAALKLL